MKTVYRLFAVTKDYQREELCEVSSREELEAKFTEYQQKYGAHEVKTGRETFTTDDGNKFFSRTAVGGKKDGQEITLNYSEMTKGNYGFSA